jgi:hypothetical protein
MSASLSGRTPLPAPLARPASPRELLWEAISLIMQTPFLQSLELDAESLRRETGFLCRSRVHGVVWPAKAGLAGIQAGIPDLFHAGRRPGSGTPFNMFLRAALLERRACSVVMS